MCVADSRAGTWCGKNLVCGRRVVQKSIRANNYAPMGAPFRIPPESRLSISHFISYPVSYILHPTSRILHLIPQATSLILYPAPSLSRLQANPNPSPCVLVLIQIRSQIRILILPYPTLSVLRVPFSPRCPPSLRNSHGLGA